MFRFVHRLAKMVAEVDSTINRKRAYDASYYNFNHYTTFERLQQGTPVWSFMVRYFCQLPTLEIEPN